MSSDKVRAILTVSVVMALAVALMPWPRSTAEAQPVPGYCSPPYKINWPASNPVWSLCWTPPDQSSGISGSGLELRHVFYKGRRVFWQAHAPVLNVKYDPGGCGGADLSYRDWQNELRAFDANNVLQPGYAEPTVPPQTVLDHPGFDSGSFAGVAVQKLADRLILTSQMSAGWYRYIQTWTFFLDGTIEPRFGFSAVSNPCTTKPHDHHAYWRFDFDIEGFPNDSLDQFDLLGIFFPGIPLWTTLSETSASRGNLFTSVWRARDKVTGRGYVVMPGPQDGVADTWAVADLWALRYHGNEIDDGGATGGPNGDAIHVSNYINGENIDGQDVVMWYHVAHRHAGGLDHSLIGPTLKPFGHW